MNRPLVDRIADAVLYEGYVLYPYRPAVKNRQRWTFGGLYPESWSRSTGGTDAASNQTEVLVQGYGATEIAVTVRFLHLTARTTGQILSPLATWPLDVEPCFTPVASLRVGDQLFHTWQEAEERRVAIDGTTLGDIARASRLTDFAFGASRLLEPLPGPDGCIVGVLVREKQALEGHVEVAATEVSAGLFRVWLRIVNRTSLAPEESNDRDAALLRSLISTHAILTVRGGEFVSLLDPPEDRREAAAGCRNIGTWPVLVGADGDKHTMLSAPIILYDYPQVAPESPGDFFDGGEIDEMLTLRILTLTDDEKQQMAAVDERTRELLARTEALARDQLLGLHGTFRHPSPSDTESSYG